MYPYVKTAPFSTIVSGNLASISNTGGVQITTDEDAKDIDYAIIQADPGNSGVLYIGDSDVSIRSLELGKGDRIEIPIKDLTKVYLRASTTSQNVQFIYFKQ